MLAEGSYQELQTSGLDFTNLLGSSTNTPDLSDECKTEKTNRLSESTVSSLGGSDKVVEPCAEVTNETKSEPVETAETRSSGNVSFNVYSSYILAGGNYCKILSLLLVCILTQVFESGGNYWISYWYYI